MRKLIFNLALILAAIGAACSSGFTQNLTQQYQATAYGKWSVTGYSPNSFTFVPSTCLVTGPSGNFVPFSTTAPITIVDANPANNETLTPTAVSVSGSSCTLTVSPANQHFSFSIQSGTCGLQEAINAVGTAQQAVIVVTPDFGNRGCDTPTIIAAAGSSNVSISDQRRAPYQSWLFNGTTYTTAGLAVAPTLAAGTGAGTGPTLTIQGSGTRGLITVTSGTTPTASGIIFTATWPALAAGGFPFAPTCSYLSYGTHLYASGTVTQTAGPPATSVLTASATALTASTAYTFTYSCH